MSNKIGFWSVFALVTGSQIGTGVFILPASLAPYGYFALIGWVISGFGSISLALVFAWLCEHFPKTGGPHVYVGEAFGTVFSFFTGWTYWVISWVSTAIVVIVAITAMKPFIGEQSSFIYVILEISLLSIITLLNLQGMKIAGIVELLLTILKFIPLLLIPLAALFFFDQQYFAIDHTISDLTIPQTLKQVTLLTLWGFIGLETATTAAGSIEHPSRTIPKAIIFGTFCVALLYFLNSFAIIGLIPTQNLMNSKAPYIDATQIIFGGDWHLIIAIITFIVCVGTLNGWTLTSGQIILGLANDGLISKFLGKKNIHGVPIYGLILSNFGIMLILILTIDDTISKQINFIIDLSVTTFLFVYLICSLAFLKLLIKQRKVKLNQFLFGFIATIFCGWIIYETSLQTIVMASLFIFSGIPIYLCNLLYIKK
jgi:APA family basic amino acid/polyamine antiporter